MKILRFVLTSLLGIILMLDLSLSLDAAPALKTDLDITRDKPYGGILRWGVHTKPDIINPILTHSGISMTIGDLIFNSLVRMNGEGDIEPDLAESWDISEDGLVYTFHLREGVLFHDGVECTADDVLFSFQAMMDPAVESIYAPKLAIVDEWKFLDKYTIQARLREPQAHFLVELKHLCIGPKHLLDGVDLKNTPYNHAPIGTGPFKFSAWSEKNVITLSANEKYFEGRPYLDHVEFTPYANISDIWTALMRGENDIALFIDKKDYEVVKQDSTFKTFAAVGPVYYGLAYNLTDSILSNINMRRAITIGIDEDELIRRAANGYGIISTGPFPPDSWGYNPAVKGLGYDPFQAKELIRQSGWTDKDGLFYKEGKTLEYEVAVYAKDEVQKTIALLIRQQLQKIGIKIQINYFDDYQKKIQEFSGSSQILLHTFYSKWIDPGLLMPDWHSEFPQGGKLWGYKNENVDHLFEKANAMVDRDERKPLYQEIHKIIYEDQPQCFLFFPYGFFGVRSNFHGTDLYFNSFMPVYAIKDWWVEETENTE